MNQLTEDFNNRNGKIIINHNLWGQQIFNCEKIEVINNDKLGVRINGHDVFVLKDDVVSVDYNNNMLKISDHSLTITIICE